MFEAVGNTFRVPELRRKIIITALLLCACRVGVYVPVPGINYDALQRYFEGVERGSAAPVMNLVNLFAGGALRNCAIFGLGVMPYISASIIFQLLASVIPALEKLQKEGEAGRKKINQYTRYATVLLCLIQAAIMLGSFRGRSGPDAIFPESFGFGSLALAALLMTCGTLLLMWIGEQIDEYGIGNGMSLIIMVNIIARMPTAVQGMAADFTWDIRASGSQVGPTKMVALIALFVGVVVAIIFITQGQRRIPFQQAKQTRGRRVYGGMKHYLPLQVNSAGVIPVIFASSLLMFPAIFTGAMAARLRPEAGESSFFHGMVSWLDRCFQYGTFGYILLYVVLIFFFCYFWTAIQFNPNDMADNLKDHGSFIPGIRPGKRTGDHLERIMTRITLPGAAFLAVIAIMPMLMLRGFQDLRGRGLAGLYGGTGLLIVVGVALDLVKKIEAQLLIRHYDGFTRAARRR